MANHTDPPAEAEDDDLGEPIDPDGARAERVKGYLRDYVRARVAAAPPPADDEGAPEED